MRLHKILKQLNNKILATMFWFRMGFCFNLVAAFVWDVGVVCGIIMMWTQGNAYESMEQDPTKNGTVSVYLFILVFQFALLGSSLFGFFICFKIWRNQFQMDKQLRSNFIIWFVTWVISLLGVLSVGIYAFVRGKNPQGQVGFMYEIFQRNSQVQMFVAAFERFQREHSCCGIYGPDDWLMSQLQQQPGGAAWQTMDFGMQMNPSTGKCHMYPPTIPVGCGKVLMFVTNRVVTMYAGLTMFQLVLGIAAGVMAWYCFFYWLEEEVMILPTDELCEIIVVEPPDENASELELLEEENELLEQELREERYLEPGVGYMHDPSRYMNAGSRSGGAPIRKSYIHSVVGPDGKKRSYLYPADKPNRSIAMSRQRSIHHNRDTNNVNGRTRTQVYMTKSQLEAERHQPARRNESRESRVSRRTHNRGYVQEDNAPVRSRARNRSRRDLAGRDGDYDEGETARRRRSDTSSRHSRSSQNRHNRTASRNREHRSSRSPRSRHGSPRHSSSSSESSEDSEGRRVRSSRTRQHHRERQGGSRTSAPRDNQAHHGSTAPPPQPHHSRTGSRSRPVEAKILYKNHNALDRNDSI